MIKLLLLIILSFEVYAHPVIYKDGVVVSSSNMTDYSDNQLMYSWSNKWASGLNHWRFGHEGNNSDLALVKTNYLLFRKNTETSQGNIYLHGGAGIIDSELEKKKDTREAYMAGIDIDWETRTLYTAFKYYHFTSPGLTDIPMTQARIGFSPYEAGFDKLQTWFMLQAMYMPDVQKEVIITPMVRFFYHNVLWELGSSTRGEWMLNFMVHY